MWHPMPWCKWAWQSTPLNNPYPSTPAVSIHQSELCPSSVIDATPSCHFTQTANVTCHHLSCACSCMMLSLTLHHNQCLFSLSPLIPKYHPPSIISKIPPVYSSWVPPFTHTFAYGTLAHNLLQSHTNVHPKIHLPMFKHAHSWCSLVGLHTSSMGSHSTWHITLPLIQDLSHFSHLHSGICVLVRTHQPWSHIQPHTSHFHSFKDF